MLLDRLRRMTAEELRWRAAVAARRNVERVACRLRKPRWDRAALAHIVSPSAIDAALGDAISRGEWPSVHHALRERLRARPARFVLDPAAARLLPRAVLARWPSAADEAARRADRIIEGEHDLLGYGRLSFAGPGGRIDWHFDPVHARRAPRIFYAQVPYLDAAIGDHKVIWEINRHQHWLRLGRAAWLTGNSRYASAILDDLDGWMHQNPPLVGINWASMLEIGFRALSWTWALHCLLGVDEPPARSRTAWLVDLVIGLHRQLTHLEHNLSYYFSPNTHLTGEALALYVAGTALPELAASGRWASTGRRILLAEIERQILPDGGHVERSTHYQRYTLDFYLLGLLTARLAGDGEAEARFSDAALRLAEFTRVMADDRGHLPLIGDDDGGMLWPLTGRACNDVRDSLALAASLFDRPDLAPWGPAEEVAWVGGAAALTGCMREVSPAAAVSSRVFPDSGYAIARDMSGGHAVLDAGPHGYRNAGHAHADALSLTLAVGGRPLLVDPGTSTYTMDAALRDRMRSTAAHNTLTLDGRSQSMPAGPFQWRSRADARLDMWRQNHGFDWAEASHDGYAPERHRRSLVRAEGSGWLIVDDVIGSGHRVAAAHWHFDPEWMVTLDGARVRASHADGTSAWLLGEDGDLTLHRGDTASGLGWMAPVYGTLVPTWMARIVRAAEAPFTMLTWVGGGDEWQRPSLTRVAAECDPMTPAIGAQVTDGDRAAIFMLRPGGSAPHAARACRVAHYETDARMLHYRCAGDRLLAVDIAEGRYLTPSRNGWLALEADRRIPDLHVSVADGILELRASAPPPPLRLRVATAFDLVRLNGREFPRDVTFPASLSLHPTDWGVDTLLSPPTRPLRDCGAAFADH